MPRTVIWDAWCLHVGTLGGYCGILGPPWATLEQQEGHMGIQGRIFVDLGMISGTSFESCVDHRAFEFPLFVEALKKDDLLGATNQSVFLLENIDVL